MQTLRSGQAVSTICAAAALSDDAMRALEGSAEARAFVQQLADAKAWGDAVAFLAHALPRREAVWWAWLCARDTAGEKAPAPLVASLEATKAWVADPSDENRQAALNAAQALGIATPAGMAGLAVFLCGETLGPASAPPTAAPEFVAAKAIAGCVNLAAINEPKSEPAERYAELVRRGLELADRISLWTPPAEASPAPGQRQ